MTTRIPIPLYDLLMAETEREGISQNEVVVRALRSALGERQASAVKSRGRSVGTSPGSQSEATASRSAQTQVLEETVASPCCGADLDESEGRRFCSDCGTLVPS